MARGRLKSMDMADVISPFSEMLKVDVLRYDVDDEGLTKEVLISSFDVRGSLQPVSNKLEQEDHGNYNKQKWNLYTFTLIPVTIQDDIRIEDRYFRVTNKKDWSMYGYYKYVLDERYSKNK